MTINTLKVGRGSYQGRNIRYENDGSVTHEVMGPDGKFKRIQFVFSESFTRPGVPEDGPVDHAFEAQCAGVI